jgi:hypothetical protein
VQCRRPAFRCGLVIDLLHGARPLLTAMARRGWANTLLDGIKPGQARSDRKIAFA